MNLRISQMNVAPWCSKWTDGWDWVGPPGGVRYMRYRVQIIVYPWIHIYKICTGPLVFQEVIAEPKEVKTKKLFYLCSF